MIDADIRGKLRRSGGSDHDRSEDLLTSTVFGLLRYLPVEEVMRPLIEAVCPAEDLLDHSPREHGKVRLQPWIDLKGATYCDIDFWPFFKGYGQPDVLLTFRDRHQRLVHRVVVEAKLHSPKSGEACEDKLGEQHPEAEEAQSHPDQLVKYWDGLVTHPKFSPQDPSSVVYLTAHTSPPKVDLAASLDVRPDMRLGWMSWRHIWEVVSPFASGEQSILAATDLERLLAHRGFGALCAYRMAPLSLKGDGHFWIPNPWFVRSPPPLPSATRAFWSAR